LILSKLLLFEKTSKNKKTFLFVWYFAHLFVPLTSSKVLRHGNKIQKNVFLFVFLITYSYLCSPYCVYVYARTREEDPPQPSLKGREKS
jgi:hypothetical protein